MQLLLVALARCTHTRVHARHILFLLSSMGFASWSLPLDQTADRVQIVVGVMFTVLSLKHIIETSLIKVHVLLFTWFNPLRFNPVVGKRCMFGICLQHPATKHKTATTDVYLDCSCVPGVFASQRVVYLLRSTTCVLSTGTPTRASTSKVSLS